MSVPVVIVNPQSAGGQTGGRWPRLEGQIREALGHFHPLFTERAGHATELCRAALGDGADLVIAMGGDGTLNEVVNGFFFRQPDGSHRPVRAGAAFAPLPAGSGGDFPRSAGTPRGLADSVHKIAAATARAIDVGRLTFVDHDGNPAVRHFINVASFGVSGLVDRYVNRSGKAFGGTAAFFLASLRATLSWKNAPVRITVDDRPTEEQRIYTVAVANGRYFGGGMMVAPHAELDDGQLDIVTIGDVSTARMLLDGARIYSGGHLGLPYVSSTRARRLVAESATSEEVLLDVDGEQPGRLPATFEIVPLAIHIRC